MRSNRCFDGSWINAPRCCSPRLNLDLRAILYPEDGDIEACRNTRLNQTGLTQPALFSVEYALARLWMSWGVEPAALVGHSIGEYVAAVLAGVMTLEEGIDLIATRGQLMQALPGGSMLSVRLPEEELRALVTPPLGLAAINSPRHCVVSGPSAAIDALRQELEGRKVGCRVLRTSHAFHSPMMEPMLAEFAATAERCRLRNAERPILSTMTGDWLGGGNDGGFALLDRSDPVARCDSPTQPRVWASNRIGFCSRSGRDRCSAPWFNSNRNASNR
jgi:phthiocerol/phenolphthiocerol synthesis type-I polyketide synthase E